MALYDPSPHDRHHATQKAISVEDRRIVPYAFSDIREYLLDTRNVLPTRLNGARVEYPHPKLRLGDMINVHLSALVKKDFLALVTQLEESREGFRVMINVDEPGFAITSLKVHVGPDRRDQLHKTFAHGMIHIEDYRAPIPARMIKPVAKRAINSFINTTVQNIKAIHNH